MELPEIFENLHNGNLACAKHEAGKHSAKTLLDAARDYGFNKIVAAYAIIYLKTGECYAEFAAEKQNAK